MSVKVSTFYLTSYKKYLKRSYAFKMKKTNRGLRNSEIQSNYHHKVMTSHPHFARSTYSIMSACGFKIDKSSLAWPMLKSKSSLILVSCLGDR